MEAQSPSPEQRSGPVHQRFHETRDPGLTPTLQAFRIEDVLQFPARIVQIVIDDDIVIFRPMADLGLGLAHAFGDRFVTVLRA